MLLRNGKIKELIAKCYKCNEFYGNKLYNYKCSGCHGGVKMHPYPWRDEEFRNGVNEWAEKKIKIIKETGGFSTLRHVIKKVYNGYTLNRLAICKGFIKNIREVYKKEGHEFYISARDGEELLRKTGVEAPEKFHIICPLILDWWNMKNYNFNSSEMCYYGRFGDEICFCEQINSIPPPPPNNCMSI